MFFVLSKILDFVLSPMLWFIGLLLLAFVLRRTKWGARLLLSAMGLALLLTNNALVNEALLAWELPPRSLAQLGHRDAGVLLTGITSVTKSPHDRVYVNQGADRLLHTLWLYRAGRIRKIIVSGGSGAIGTVVARSEARELSILLRLAGVPTQDILLETQSRNTHENARNTKALLAQHPEINSLVLITSAFHERRAMGCFQQVGLQPVAFPASYYSTDRRPTLTYWLVPSDDAPRLWSILIHEMVGYGVYRLLGYV
ncbi:YdcF family protein [Hymenobacter taeanensis]|uniref:YdcF family protein n=1 Tax=Hymenobacter taeanensis TaxID=2735321 RepID=A0A6M6BKG0_9BACT|nr:MULTISPECIES: YdcF family protein [Hymenobacter]QJX48348.1 YdcF family protein [Hymenobacter taeanensis]UOQ82160.1 YdcF family protein [Hymenobacter sp. 5414T-23]